MGLISPGVENLLDILDLRQVLSSHDEDPMDTLWWPVERPVPIELLGGFSGFLSRRYRSLRPCVEFWLEPEDSSPVLTWILGYFWSLHKGAIPRLVWGHARALSSRPVAAVSRLPSRGSRDLWLFLEAFRRGFPTGLSHVPPWSELILCVKIEAVQGKQVPLEWTEASGELLELWHDPGVPLAFPCESASHWDATGMPGILSGEAGNWSLISSYEAETGLLWMWAGPLCFLSSGVGYVGELLELQQGCEGPFRISTGQMWLASRRLSGNGPHLPWWREPSGFSRVAAGALELRRGPQRPALAASGKGSPHASCSGASRDSSPFDAGALVLVLSRAGTWGLFSCADMDLGVILESPQGSQSSSRVGACTWTFLPSCSCSVTLPVMWLKGSVAFPGGFPTGLSHVPPWCELILGMKVEAVQGKQLPLEWTEISGGLLEWWQDPGVPLAFPVESASSWDSTGMLGILSRRSRERIPHLELRGGNVSPLDVRGTPVLPLEWRRACRGSSLLSSPEEQPSWQIGVLQSRLLSFCGKLLFIICSSLKTPLDH